MAEDKLCSCAVYNQKGNHHTIKRSDFCSKAAKPVDFI